jgi:hypothetical protein
LHEKGCDSGKLPIIVTRVVPVEGPIDGIKLFKMQPLFSNFVPSTMVIAEGIMELGKAGSKIMKLSSPELTLG